MTAAHKLETSAERERWRKKAEGPSYRTVAPPPRRRTPPDTSSSLGPLLVGLAALAMGALAVASISEPKPRRRRIVGGVDLTNTDVSRPFLIDFSVAPTADVATKQAALAKLRVALVALQAELPNALCNADIKVAEGRLILGVTPLGPDPSRS